MIFYEFAYSSSQADGECYVKKAWLIYWPEKVEWTKFYFSWFSFCCLWMLLLNGFAQVIRIHFSVMTLLDVGCGYLACKKSALVLPKVPFWETFLGLGLTWSNCGKADQLNETTSTSSSNSRPLTWTAVVCELHFTTAVSCTHAAAVIMQLNWLADAAELCSNVQIHSIIHSTFTLHLNPVCFHYLSWRPELTDDRFPLPVNTVNSCKPVLNPAGQYAAIRGRQLAGK